MARLLRLLLILSLPIILPACTAVKDTIIAEEMTRFAEDVVALSKVISDEFDLAEEINTRGFTDSLLFQIELGGAPDTDLKPLFNARDIAARQELLAALGGYVTGLAAIGAGQSPKAAYAGVSGAAAGLKALSTDSFNLSHSLSFLQSDQLINDLDLFDQFLLLPERDRRLAPLLEKAGEAIRKSAFLLYVDIGAPSDQSTKCSFTVPANDPADDMRSLKLCRGGLRSIIATAIAFNVTVWKDRLAHMTALGADSAASRRAIVTHLVGLQKFAGAMDALLSQTQSALISMVATHVAIAAAVRDSGSMDTSPSLIASSRVLLFREEVEALKTRAATETSVLNAFAANAPDGSNLGVAAISPNQKGLRQ